MSLLRTITYRHALCRHCKYFLSKRVIFPKCAVFQHFGKAIPDEILTSRFDHRFPHPEDGGIDFERESFAKLRERTFFRYKTDDEIEEHFQITLTKLNKIKDQPTTNDGHLPSIWFMYDD